MDFPFGPLSGQPCYDVGDVLERHGSARNVAAPVRCAEVWSSDDDHGAEALIAHQGEIRGVHNRTAPLCAMAGVTVARRAVRPKYVLASSRIAWQ